MNLRSITVLAVTSLATSGCSLFIHDPLPTASVPSVQAQASVDHKHLTVLVIAQPAPALRRTFEGISARTTDADASAFFRGHAEGAFGSGAYIIRDEGDRQVPYVVTNRHVVADSSTVEVQFADGMTYRNCPVIFENPTEDLAIVQLPDSALKVQSAGYTISAALPTERDLVVASGYPGVGGQPSYQLTEGKVSNSAFALLNDATSRTSLIQHTAPIDPGSSGGPLVNAHGEVVGINVAMVRGRQGLNLAVPARAIEETLRHVMAARAVQGSAVLGAESLDRACARLGAELATADMDVQEAVSYVSNEFAGKEGLPSYIGALRLTRSPNLARMIANEPIQGMRAGILIRLKATAQLQGISGECTPANPADLANLTAANTVRMNLRAAKGNMELRWVFEHGNWRVASGRLVDLNALADAAEADEAKEPSKTVKTKSTKTRSR